MSPSWSALDIVIITIHGWAGPLLHITQDLAQTQTQPRHCLFCLIIKSKFCCKHSYHVIWRKYNSSSCSDNNIYSHLWRGDAGAREPHDGQVLGVAADVRQVDWDHLQWGRSRDNTIQLLLPGIAWATLCYIVHIIIIFWRINGYNLGPKSRKYFNEQKKMRSNSQYTRKGSTADSILVFDKIVQIFLLSLRCFSLRS